MKTKSKKKNSQKYPGVHLAPEFSLFKKFFFDLLLTDQDKKL